MKPVVCLVGPTGVGKSSYAQRLVDEHGYRSCRIYTTRPNRQDDRAHITCITLQTFQRIHDQGGLLECDMFQQFWYGTCLKNFYALLHTRELLYQHGFSRVQLTVLPASPDMPLVRTLDMAIHAVFPRWGHYLYLLATK